MIRRKYYLRKIRINCKEVIIVANETISPEHFVDEDEKAAERYNRSRRGFFRILFLFILLIHLWAIFVAYSMYTHGPIVLNFSK